MSSKVDYEKTVCVATKMLLCINSMFYAAIDPKILKKEREKARELRKSNWWQQKLNEGLCYYCQNTFSKDELTMDHKVPLARGGLSSRNNIVVCCKDCNTKKQSKTSVDFTL